MSREIAVVVEVDATVDDSSPSSEAVSVTIVLPAPLKGEEAREYEVALAMMLEG